MDTSFISYKNIQGIFNIQTNIDDEIELIPTSLDEQGIKLLIDDIKHFIDETDVPNPSDVVIKPSNEEKPLGIILDMYVDWDWNEEPETYSFWFEDYIDESEEYEEDENEIKPVKFKKDEY